MEKEICKVALTIVGVFILIFFNILRSRDKKKLKKIECLNLIK